MPDLTLFPGWMQFPLADINLQQFKTVLASVNSGRHEIWCIGEQNINSRVGNNSKL